MPHHFAVITTLAAGLLAAPMPARAGMIDQRNVVDQSGGVFFINSAQDLAQTFTVGRTGLLDRFDVQVTPESDVTAALLVDIRRTTLGGVPSPDAASVLFRDSVSLSTSTDFVRFDLGILAFPVTAGDVLAITLSSSDPSLGYDWAVSNADTYPRGALFARTPPAGPFITSGNDAGFRTYVQSVPEPSSVAQVVIGAWLLAGCAWRRWRPAV